MQEATFFIPFVLPTLNEVIAKAKSHPMAYANWKRAIQKQITPWAAHLPIFDHVQVDITWCEKDRRRDPDNVIAGGKKFILDALVNDGKLPDDGHKHIKGFSDMFEFGRPGVRVILREILTK